MQTRATFPVVRSAGPEHFQCVDLRADSAGALLGSGDSAARWRTAVSKELGPEPVVFVHREVAFDASLAPRLILSAALDGGVPQDEVYSPEGLSELIARENAMAFDILVSQLRSPMGVVPFVGAGLSVDFGFPAWQRFLSEASEFCSKPDRVLSAIASGNYFEAASVLYEDSADRFQLMVAKSFGGPVTYEQARTGAVSLLPILARGPVITTNFDRVLETAYQAAGLPFDYVITGPETDNVIRAMHRNEHALIKIHGDAQDRSARVFTVKEYEQQYVSSAAPPAARVAGTVTHLANVMFTNRPLLFLGCSLDRDRVLTLLEELHKSIPGLTHYAVLATAYSLVKVRARRRDLDNYGIVPLWYSPGDFSSIAQILQQLIQEASTRIVWRPPIAAPEPVRARSGATQLAEPTEIVPAPEITPLIRRLARKIVNGQLCFFLGSGSHLNAILSARSFYNSLAKDYEFEEADSQRAEVAQYIVDREGKSEAWAAAKSQLQRANFRPSVVYRFLSELPALLRGLKRAQAAQLWCLTTNYDAVLEETLDRSDEPFHLLYYQVDGHDRGRFLHRALDGTVRAIEAPENIRAFEGQAHVVCKLDGGIPWDEHMNETVAISPMDFSISAGRLPSALPEAVRRVLRDRTLLVLGSSLRDPHVQSLIRWSTEGKGVVKTWAIQRGTSDTARKYWAGARVELVDCDLAMFVPALRQRIVEYASENCTNQDQT